MPPARADAAASTAHDAPTLPATPSALAARSDTARTAGRGGLAIAFAKVSFILFGFGQQIVLPAIVGVTGYGQIARVLAIVSIVNNVIVATAIQGVSRAVSSTPAPGHLEAFRRTLGIHALLAVIVATGLALLAGPIADAVGAPHVTSPLRLASCVVLLYGVYAPLVGALNGQKRFVHQAGLDIGYGALRFALMAGTAAAFTRLAAGTDHAEESGVQGAVLGFIAAAGLIVPVALSRSGLGKRGPSGPSAREHLRFLLPLLFGQVALNVLMQTDFMLLSRFLGDAAARAGLGTDAADAMVASYRAVQLFSFLPYQLLVSITFVLFPMLATAHATGDRDAVRRYVGAGVRLALVLTGLFSGVIAALAPHVLRLAFPAEIADSGGAALRVLSLGMGSFALLGIASAALTSLGREVTTFAVTLATVAFVAVACFALVPGAPFGPDMLTRSAVATSLGLALSAVAAGFALRRAAGAFAAPSTLLRVVAATAATVAIGSQLPWLGKPAVVAEAAVVAALYLLVLVATREVGRADLAPLAALVGRKKTR
jgi:stage V sporulation protein B